LQDNKHFDLWAKNYDADVGVSNGNDEYPFAGYKKILGDIYHRIMQSKPAKILDIGIGTGTLCRKLYEQGNDITGIDFSEEMLNASRKNIPDAKLIQWDFTKGLPDDIGQFDFIISTYAIHHLTDTEKVTFIILLLSHLNDGGCIIIGDVGFESRELLEECRAACGDSWDEDESYFVVTELRERLGYVCELEFWRFSHCSGILVIKQSA